MSAGEEETHTRGVKNPKVVDLILPRDGEIVLQMIEDRPWGSEVGQLDQLGEKFNNYLDYVLDGWFIRQYPGHAGKEVCIELEYTSALGPQEEEMLAEITRFSSSVGLRFEARKSDS